MVKAVDVREPEFRDGDRGRAHGGGAPHVAAHELHGCGRLEGDPARVEGNAFADERDGRGLRVGRAAVVQLEQLWRLGGALRHTVDMLPRSRFVEKKKIAYSRRSLLLHVCGYQPFTFARGH